MFDMHDFYETLNDLEDNLYKALKTGNDYIIELNLCNCLLMHCLSDYKGSYPPCRQMSEVVKAKKGIGKGAMVSGPIGVYQSESPYYQ